MSRAIVSRTISNKILEIDIEYQILNSTSTVHLIVNKKGLIAISYTEPNPNRNFFPWHTNYTLLSTSKFKFEGFPFSASRGWHFAFMVSEYTHNCYRGFGHQVNATKKALVFNRDAVAEIRVKMLLYFLFKTFDLYCIFLCIISNSGEYFDLGIRSIYRWFSLKLFNTNAIDASINGGWSLPHSFWVTSYTLCGLWNWNNVRWKPKINHR